MSFPETNHPYDTWARAYRDWWGPVIEPSAVRLLDRLDGALPHGEQTPFELLDVGTGTGALAVAALQRWPTARVTGVDPASRMLQLATDAARRRAPQDAARLRLLVGSADELPLPDASMDVAVTSFVIQLVPSRAAALREIARVLRPGGMFACVTWQAEGDPFEPDEAFMDAVDELQIDAPPIEGGSRPYMSAAAAAAEIRRQGFAQVAARTEWLEHRYTAQSYLGTLEHWIEPELFGNLGWVRRRELRREALRHMRRLPPEAFLWRRPLVSVVARRR
jgi:ubiquinone/menaquinone biosynthesis C-methylase UbiE